MKALLMALADGGIEDKAHERRRRLYQGFYSCFLKTRGVLRVDEPRRLLRALRRRIRVRVSERSRETMDD